MKYGDIVTKNGQTGMVVEDPNMKSTFHFLPSGYGTYSSGELDVVTESDVQAATEDEKTSHIRKCFNMGRITDIHKIGEYQFIEYVSNLDNETAYHGYINYHDVNASWETLDEALVGIIGIKYDGAGSKAAMYFMRMIKD